LLFVRSAAGKSSSVFQGWIPAGHHWRQEGVRILPRSSTDVRNWGEFYPVERVAELSGLDKWLLRGTLALLAAGISTPWLFTPGEPRTRRAASACAKDTGHNVLEGVARESLLQG
jgi:hypothetical protein